VSSRICESRYADAGLGGAGLGWDWDWGCPGLGGRATDVGARIRAAGVEMRVCQVEVQVLLLMRMRIYFRRSVGRRRRCGVVWCGWVAEGEMEVVVVMVMAKCVVGWDVVKLRWEWQWQRSGRFG
jgi:hypothetical protein